MSFKFKRVLNAAVTALAVIVTTVSFPAVAQEAAGQGLLAGAARLVVTPTPGMLPDTFESVHDDLYVRALFLRSGHASAILAIVDAPMMHADIEKAIRAQVSQDYSIAPEYVLLGVTHTHSSLRIAPTEQYLNVPNADQLSQEELTKIRETILHRIPVNDAFNARVTKVIQEAIRQAFDNLQPARAGFATGHATITASRNEWLESQHRYIDGIDRTGTQPVDHVLAVQKFESLSGEPIALLLNYGFEPILAPSGIISGDVPGATSSHLERVLGGNAVALFTIGAAESPRYRVWPDSNRDTADALRIMQAMGVILGEEALAVADQIDSLSPSLAIWASTDELQCPGKITTPRNLREQCSYSEDSDLPACVFNDTDIAPVTMPMGLLRLGDVAYVVTVGNVVPALSLKLQQRSPLQNTLLLSANFGAFRFVVDDAAYPLNTYPATDTRAKSGCAEQGFINGALRMIAETL